MTNVKEWLRDLFTRPEVEPFVPEEDPFVQRAHDAMEASKQRRVERKSVRERWKDRSALERELLGGGR